MKAKLIVTLDDGRTFVKEDFEYDSKAFFRDQRTGEVICRIVYEIKIEEAAWVDMIIRHLKEQG